MYLLVVVCVNSRWLCVESLQVQKNRPVQESKTVISPQGRTAKSIIKENMAQILQWVEQGYRVKVIYQTLQETKELGCSFANFTKYYYQFRNSGEVFSTTGSSNTQLHASEQTFVTDKLSEEQVTPTKKETPVAEKNKALIPDFDYEENQRLARMIFDKRKSQQNKPSKTRAGSQSSLTPVNYKLALESYSSSYDTSQLTTKRK